MQQLNIFWFRRDLRINDNHGFYKALTDGLPVLPVFIFDTDIISLLDEKNDRRLTFIILQLKKLQNEFTKFGSTIEIIRSKPTDAFKKLVSEFKINKVFANHDYEPYSLKRDAEINQFLKSKGIEFLTFKDQVIFEKNEIIKSDGLPYTIFTPFSRKWKEKLEENNLSEFSSDKYLHNLFKKKALEFKDYYCDEANETEFPLPQTDIELLRKYAENRNIPGIKGTSRLGVHLRFGTLSIRDMVKKASQHSDTWLNELIWREFFMQILFHFPHVVNQSFKPVYDNIKWINNERDFQRWCEGTTGYALVDAGMRELNETGFMHNRVRMLTASFLSKHLLIDWRWGEAYFASKLLDFELSSNNGNWQWAAGSGCDAAPYFRIFNPETQQRKYDPDLIYIKKWVPEFGSFKYPEAIVEHEYARKRCLQAYKKAFSD